MKPLLTFLALGCLLTTGATVPPFPTVSTNRPKVLTNVVRQVRFTPPPSSHGVSYTNKLSLLDSNRWVSGWTRSSPRYVPHNFRHDAATGEFTVDWPSVPGRRYVLEAAWGEFPRIDRNEERKLVTNMHPSTVFYAVETNGAWFNTNRSMVKRQWNTTNLYVRIVEL